MFERAQGELEEGSSIVVIKKHCVDGWNFRINKELVLRTEAFKTESKEGNHLSGSGSGTS